jgi:hypothetical protein
VCAKTRILPEQKDIFKSKVFFSINPTNCFGPLTIATFFSQSVSVEHILRLIVSGVFPAESTSIRRASENACVRLHKNSPMICRLQQLCSKTVIAEYFLSFT